MNKFRKIIASLITLISLLSMTPIAAHAKWKSDSTGWWYTEGSSYATGWQYIDGNWYYFYSSGYMAHDCYVENYYLNSSGAWTTNIPTVTSSTGGSTSSASVDNQSQTAYLSATGHKYHSRPDCGNMNPNKATKTTVAEAEKKGYTRCSDCW